MLRIGFTNKYYTLWNVDSQPNYTQDERGQVTLTHTKIIYTYLQNLSFDENEAKLKAKDKGCTNLEVDNDLFGRNSSWEFVAKGYCDLPRSKSPFFEFGKYSQSKIEECNDFNYLEWYYGETSNRYAKLILLSNGWSMFDDMLVTNERFEELKQKKSEREKN